ncbi:hypothetical protein LCGC14_2796040 [marine sediment metagenome]|uniref:Uncharacterized protein n=1 Tax=marine sediment metagenome TaxID=412755 RepID=A0A0F8YP18_9ZZZZ
MSFDGLLIHTCDIGALTQGVADAYNQPANTWPLAYTTQECRIMPTSGEEIKIGAQVMISDWALFLPDDVTIDEQDRVSNILLRSDGSAVDSSTFEVLHVKPRNNSLTLHHQQVLLKKVA